MEQDDEEFEQLLGEIPRATSAPPHLEELQRAYGAELNNSPFVASLREDNLSPPVKPFIDIRCDEQYENFYRNYSGVKKLPPPMENRNLYADYPLMSPKASSGNNHLSPFYSGLALDSPRTMAGMRRQKQEPMANQMGASTNSSNNSGRTASPPSDHHHPPKSADERSISAAFGNLSFEESPSNGMMGGRLHEENVGPGESRGQPNGGLDHGGPMPNGRSAAISNGLYSHMSAFSTGFAPEPPGGPLDAFGNPRPGVPSATMDLFAQKSAGPSPLEAPSNGGGYAGLEEFGGPVSHQALEKFLRRGSPPGLDAHAFNGAAARQANGLMVDAGGFAGVGGSTSAAHHQHQLEAYTAAALQAARLMNPGNGSDLYSGMEFNSNARALYSHRLHQQIDAEQRLRERQYQLQQHQQSMRFYASLQAHTNGGLGPASASRGHSPTGNSSAMRQTALLSSSAGAGAGAGAAPGSAAHHLKTVRSHEQLWTVPGAGGGASVIGHSNGELGRASLNNSICRYYAQGYCSRGDACPFLHTQASQGFGSVRVTPGNTFKEAGREDRLISDNKMLPRRGASRAAAAPAISASALQRRKPESLPNGTTPHINGHAYVNGHHPSPISFHGDVQNHIHGEHNLEYEGPRHAIVGTPHLSQQNQQPKYNTLEEVEGRIFSIAKDQHGCRFLQRKFDEGGPEDVQKIFQEIIEHIIELMTDPFGNYLVQKLLEVCNEEQRMEILHVVTEKGELVQISLNMHGTRAVQKLIETLKSPEQVAMVIASLKQGVVTLIKDLNGNHVVQRCLQRLSTEDSQFIFDAAAVHCVEIATHRHGCCVLQRCVDFASGPQRQRLVTEIAANALVLSQDPFGNYVVQYILDLGMPWASVEVMVRLEGNYPYLAMQKFSSNVVEKCLKLAGDENRSRIVRELMGSPRLGQMLQDPYANYVVQSALTVAKGSLHTGLVEAIRPHLSVLRSSPYGKRILSRTNLKK
ncbi:pumilio RNA-binding family [Marchantia polymorpha subsp. ruderalis]|uniref:C3H1-type domain-containing protein n=2 Tax=Marchantia polymorpha TaxID=3197 RepID=A0AAF6AN51_MARPO|nr:hypothetical protein MARPO_0036s0144 [Marchantia polymorpha]BBM97871.1 hypothetical protein Mp_1g09040 [Marchantia polymorpha subsp. ruderalis]|eukprot:PTQ41172.1 hypothetical protein MARPO_0036s0144 [Marchantia polymorpha]